MASISSSNNGNNGSSGSTSTSTCNPSIFFQEAPRIGNQFEEDGYLRSVLDRVLASLSSTDRSAIYDDLQRFGARAVNDLWEKAKEMDTNLPRLQQFDGYGNRIDKLHLAEGWRDGHRTASQEGLIALGYERRYGALSRVHQFAKLYIYGPSAGLYNCPLAMTDGATRLMEVLLAQKPESKVLFNELNEAYHHLTSRDPKQFWTSGQWMTERAGGSDVGTGTETVARLQSDGSYKLYGFKWFSSATDCNMTIALARIEGDDGKPIAGSRGLSCFFLRVRDAQGKLNGIQIARLKSKLGTRQVPTAELELVGARALLVSPPGRGVATISQLINITRLYNATTAVSGMRRIIALNRDFAHRRKVFGSLLRDNALHLETLASMEVQLRGALVFAFDVIRLLGIVECGNERDTANEALLLRILTPLVKLYTGKQAVAVASEGLEGFGGAGYIEDTGLPVHLRDAQVLPIWEGTTNVLAHDMLRVLQTTKGKAFTAFVRTVTARCSLIASAKLNSELKSRAEAVTAAVHTALNHVQAFIKDPASHHVEPIARELAFSLSRIYATSCLIEHAAFTGDSVDWVVAERWAYSDSHPLVPAVLRSLAPNHINASRSLALDIDRFTGAPRAHGDFNIDGTPRSKL